MANDDLTRVRSDLETIEHALAIPPDCQPREMRIYLLLAAAGLVALAGALVPHGLSPVWGMCAFIVPTIAWLRVARTESTAGECGQRR